MNDSEERENKSTTATAATNESEEAAQQGTNKQDEMILPEEMTIQTEKREEEKHTGAGFRGADLEEEHHYAEQVGHVPR